MIYGGILDLSTIDFPGRLCSVVFFSGCPFRCPYCQNHRLLSGGIKVEPHEIVEKIKRNYLVDGVCLTGGEPLAQNLDELVHLIKSLKRIGLAVKIDTNGYYPEKLEAIIDTVDFVAMDFKTTVEDYPNLTGKSHSAEKVLKSLEVITKSDVEYEIRTTVVPTIHDEDKIVEMGRILSDFGVERYVLQQFRNEDTLDPGFREITPYRSEKLIEMAKKLKGIPKIVVSGVQRT